MIRLLVAHGADPKAQESDGTTALRRAVTKQHFECMRVSAACLPVAVIGSHV